MSMISWFRKRKSEALKRVRQKVAAEKQNADFHLKMDDFLSGFGANPFHSQEEPEYKSAIGEGFEYEDERGDW